MEWTTFTIDFDYDKTFYDVLLPNGDVIPNCWPNAGKMNAFCTNGKVYSHTDNIKVRISQNPPEA